MFGKIKNMFSLDKWIENFEGYLEAKIDLIKFDIKEQLVKVLTLGVSFAGIIFFGLTCFVLLNFGVAGLINAYMESRFWGYFILAGFYLLVSLVFYIALKNKSWHAGIETAIRTAIDQPNSETHEPNP